MDERTVAEIILQYDPVADDMLTIGLGGGWNSLFSLRQWTTDESTKSQSGGLKRWQYLRTAG